MSDTSDPSYGPNAGSVSADARTLPIVVYVLYICAILTGGLTGLVGFVIALATQNQASGPVLTHYKFQIRTGLAAAALVALAVVVAIVGVPMLLVFGLGILFFKLAAGLGALACLYMLVRAIVGLVKLSGGEPYPNPDSWIV